MSKGILRGALLSVLGLVAVVSPVFAELPSHPLIEKAKNDHGQHVQYALDNGARTGLTSDGKSYYVLWLPEGSDPKNPPPMVATLHGHDDSAFMDFHAWHEIVKKRGYGLLAVQWRLGMGGSLRDYLLPNEVYRAIDKVFGDLQVKPGSALLHGFSRGSANIYPVAAMDLNLKRHFGLFVANAGKPDPDYPLMGGFERGTFGRRPFADSRWVTFGGGKDPNPDRDGIKGMRDAGDWIKKYGGTVELAIEDLEGGHGGFLENPKNCEQTLDLFGQTKMAEQGRVLVEAMQKGGYVIFFRHTSTSKDEKDTDKANLDDRSKQRNLTDQGRAEAVRLGQALASARIPVGDIYSSPYYRCLETAQLIFPGRPVEKVTDLKLIDGRDFEGQTPEDKERLKAALVRMLSTPPKAGMNTVIVGHSANLKDATRLIAGVEGQMIVVKPEPEGGFTLTGRMTPHEWENLQ